MVTEAVAWKASILALNLSSKANVRDMEVPEVAQLKGPDYTEMVRIYAARQAVVSECLDRSETAHHVLRRVATQYNHPDRKSVRRLKLPPGKSLLLFLGTRLGGWYDSILTASLPPLTPPRPAATRKLRSRSRDRPLARRTGCGCPRRQAGAMEFPSSGLGLSSR